MQDWDLQAGIKVSYGDDGIPQVQPDSYGEEQAGLSPHELHHFSGFFGIPHDGTRGANGVPDPTKCGKFLTFRQNEDNHAFPLGDLRLVLKVPVMELGSAMMYGGRKALPAFQFIDGKTGSYQLYIPYSFSSESDTATPAKAMTIGVNVREAGKESIEIVHGEGMCITMAAEDKSITIKNADGTAFVVVNADGIVCNGTTILGAPAGSVPLANGDTVEKIINQLLLALRGTFKVCLPPKVPGDALELLLVPLVPLMMELKTKNVTAT